MSQDPDSKSRPLQGHNDKPSISETTASHAATPHLKLVISNPDPVEEKAADLCETMASNTGFTAGVRNIGPQIYEMNILDPFHDLGCDLMLEIQKSRGETTAVCHFPVILNKSNKFLDEDETLYGIIAVQYPMNVLEQLFLFCIDHAASRLIIYMDDAQAEGFGIYHDFLSHYDETLTEKGEQMEMVIPTDRKAFERWRVFMNKTSLAFEQDLWREQRHNSAIRRYLKSRPRA